MADHADHGKPLHETHYQVDGEHETTTATQLTPVQIMTSAGIDPQTNYLDLLQGNTTKQSYKDTPNVEIPMQDGMRFITKPIGPMPVS